MSEILREVIRGGSFGGSVPAMSEESRLPLQILVEIGVEKLRRDYVHLIVCELNLNFADEQCVCVYCKT